MAVDFNVECNPYILLESEEDLKKHLFVLNYCHESLGMPIVTLEKRKEELRQYIETEEEFRWLKERDYKNLYLSSYWWGYIRQKALEVFDYKCCLCNSSQILNVHHRSYKNLWQEEPVKDLIVLCLECHKLFHSNRKLCRTE